MRRLFILQFVLALAALGAAGGVIAFAVNNSSTVPPGVNGGAIGLGMISAACIACLVWIEVSIYRKTQN